jgi:hypothetical protein
MEPIRDAGTCDKRMATRYNGKIVELQYPSDVQAKVDHSRGAARRRLEEIRRQRKGAAAETDG